MALLYSQDNPSGFEEKLEGLLGADYTSEMREIFYAQTINLKEEQYYSLLSFLTFIKENINLEDRSTIYFFYESSGLKAIDFRSQIRFFLKNPEGALRHQQRINQLSQRMTEVLPEQQKDIQRKILKLFRKPRPPKKYYKQENVGKFATGVFQNFLINLQPYYSNGKSALPTMKQCQFWPQFADFNDYLYKQSSKWEEYILTTQHDIIKGQDLTIFKKTQDKQLLVRQDPQPLLAMSSNFEVSPANSYSSNKSNQSKKGLLSTRYTLQKMNSDFSNNSATSVSDMGIQAIIKKVRFAPYQINPQNYQKYFISFDQEEFIPHNLIVILFALTKAFTTFYKAYFDSLSHNEMHQFVEFNLRYQFYRDSVLSLQTRLDHLFRVYGNICHQVFKCDVGLPGFVFWRPAMRQWAATMQPLHRKLTYGPFKRCLLKSKTESLLRTFTGVLSTLSDGSEGLELIRQNLHPQIQKNQPDPTKFEHYIDQKEEIFSPDFNEILAIETIDYFMDIALDEENVHWCGHRQQRHAPVYKSFSRIQLAILKKFYQQLFIINLGKTISPMFLNQVLLNDLVSLRDIFVRPANFQSLIQHISHKLDPETTNSNGSHKLNGIWNQLSLSSLISQTNSVFREREQKLQYFNQKMGIDCFYVSSLRKKLLTIYRKSKQYNAKSILQDIASRPCFKFTDSELLVNEDNKEAAQEEVFSEREDSFADLQRVEQNDEDQQYIQADLHQRCQDQNNDGL